MLLITHKDLVGIVADVGLDALMDQLIDQLQDAFAQYDPSQIEIPIRTGFDYAEPRPGLLEWMPLLNHGAQMLLKLVGYHPRNPELSRLPTILSTFSLYDATTGQALAMVDGTLATAMRTGAASALVTRLLSREDSRVLGLIGCGAQAVTQLHAISRVRDIDRVLIYDIEQAAVETMQDRCRHLRNWELVPASVEEILAHADILSVATSVAVHAGPLWDNLPTKPHLHINAVGSDFPGKIELPKSLLERSFITPDCLQQAAVEGECQQLNADQIDEESFKLIQACAKADGGAVPASIRELRDTLTVFDSTGWALEDYVITQLILQHAERLSLGARLSMDLTIDPKSPYGAFLIQEQPHNIEVA